LHLTQNYDGQLTNQTGIHALWESRLPELFGNGYNYYAGKARYIENPLKEAFKICRTSYRSIDSVLVFERKLNKTFPPDKKYIVIKRGNRNVKDYSLAYCQAYHKALHGMVARRMRSSVLSVGSFWYSAWVDAGQPNLDKLIDHSLTSENKKQIDKEETAFKKGKVLAPAK
jgi:hypothetical protein